MRVIEQLKKDLQEAWQPMDKESALDTLCDGAYLENFDWTEEEVEEAYNFIDDNWES